MGRENDKVWNFIWIISLTLKKVPPSNKCRTLKGWKLRKHWGWVIIRGNTVLFSFCFLIDFQCRPSRQKYIEVILNTNGDLYRIIYKKKDEWYIKWQWVTTTGNNKWQRMTTSANEWQQMVQLVATNNIDWQQAVISVYFPFFQKTNALPLTTQKRTL